jgi:hypothetical protein
VELGADVGADDVFDADDGGINLADLEELRHDPALVFGQGFIALLHHAQSGNGQFQLDLDLGLLTMSAATSWRRFGMRGPYHDGRGGRRWGHFGELLGSFWSGW